MGKKLEEPSWILEGSPGVHTDHRYRGAEAKKKKRETDRQTSRDQVVKLMESQNTNLSPPATILLGISYRNRSIVT